MKIFILFLIILFSTKVFSKEKVFIYSQKEISNEIENRLTNLSFEYDFKLKVVPKKRLNYILKPWKESTCEKLSKRCYPYWIVLNEEPFSLNEYEKEAFLFKQLVFGSSNVLKKASNENKKYIMTNKSNKKIIQLLDKLNNKE